MSEDVTKWLDERGLGKYADVFEENEIGVLDLPLLSDDDLRELGLPMGPRKRLLAAISNSAEETKKDTLPLVQPPASGEAEHRQLTVMFCDLADSTALSQRLEAETYREVILSYQETCTHCVERYEGYLARLFGDGLLVYFGYPQAHEDDAERAIHAAIEVLREIRAPDENQGGADEIELAVRIGIATGPVLVGDIVGEGAAQESTVLGETPNLASRLQTLAGRNEIIVSPATQTLAGGRFTYRDLGPQKLKGMEAAVTCWRVTGERDSGSRFEATHGEHLVPLVGRDEERDMLLRRWHRASGGAGQIVLVSGEAGIGKSRLSRALREHVAEDTYTLLSYQCSPYHVSSALYPVINHLERAARFLSDDTPETRMDKLEQLLAESTDQVESAAPLLAALLSLPGENRYGAIGLTPAQQKDRTLSVLVDQLEGLASKQPVLVVFEDVHWVGPTTLELLDLIVERARRVCVLVLFTHRPEFTAAWTGEAHVTSIALNKLDPENCSALVEAVTAGQVLPSEVLEEIVEKTDGVPLFVEELTKTVIESGMLRAEAGRYVLDQPLTALAIPATLQDSLMARLDRLASAKDIAQIGAVIGREFGHELIEAVASLDASVLNEGLEKLAQAGLVFRRGTPPQVSYQFKHALIQDTAYASLLKSRRQQLHAKIGSTLESRFPELIESQPELAAHHLHQAGLTAPAIEYWHQAAKLASSRSAMNEAYSHLGAALNALETLPKTDDTRRLRLNLLAERVTPIIAVRSYSSPEMVELYEDAMSVYHELEGDTPQIFPIIYARWVFDFTGGRMKRALEHAEEFLTEAKRQNAPIPIIQGRRLYGSNLVMFGDPQEGYRHLALAELDESQSDEIGFFYGQDTLASLSCYVAFALCALGMFDQLSRRIEIALARAVEVNNPLSIAYVYGHMALLLNEIGDDAGLKRCLASMEATLDEHPIPLWVAILGYLQGVMRLTEDRSDQAVSLIQHGITVSEQLGVHYLRPIFQASLGRAYLAQDELTLAQDAVSRGLAEIDNGRDQWAKPELHRIRGDILALQQPDRAEAAYEEALNQARAYPNRLYELRAGMSLARCWSKRARRSEARKLLEAVCDSVCEPGQNRDYQEAKKVLLELT